MRETMPNAKPIRAETIVSTDAGKAVSFSIRCWAWAGNSPQSGERRSAPANPCVRRRSLLRPSASRRSLASS